MAKSFAELPGIDVSALDEAYWTGDLASVMARTAARYGPIFKWESSSGPDAGQIQVSMVGPEANRFVLHTHREHFSHDLGWTPLVGETFGRGLLNMDEPEHGRHRKMWNPAFAGAYIGTYLPIIQRVIDERTRSWLEKGEVDLYSESREITFDIAAEALAGIHTGEQVDRLRRLYYTLTHGFDADNVAGPVEDFYAHYMATRDELIGMVLAMIQERRAAPEDEQPRDVLGMIVRARDDYGQALTDEQVLAHVNILLLAGHETTTTLATWALYLLSTLPEQRGRLEAELDGALGEGGESPGSETFRNLRVMDNFVRETGRLYPPVLNVPRGVVREFEFGDYAVPEGVQVRLALAACHMLPEVFKDPERFDPDRLAPPREEDKKTPYSLVTFGGGPRVCIGQHFAHLETKALLAHVLRHHRLQPVEGQHPVHTGFYNAFIPDGIRVKVSAIRPSGDHQMLGTNLAVNP